MPIDRLLHPRLGHSRKITALTDLEFRVWTQYLLSADDFGVMRCAVVTIQAANKALATRTSSPIRRALDRLFEVGLVLRFEHQGDTYVCQHDWQDFQKITFPRQTTNPKPPDEILERFTTLTRTLLNLYPGGKKTIPKKSENAPETILDNSENTSEEFRDPARAHVRGTATATANGLRQTASADGGSLIPRGVVLGQGASAGRPPVPHLLHERFLSRLSPPMVDTVAEAELHAFYARIRAEWADKEIRPASDFDFWSTRYDEWRPVPPKKRAGEKDFNAMIAAFQPGGSHDRH